jgi:23S rRNA pseudouridine1911/1915/1917 synthase
MPAIKKITITEEQSGQRLDIALSVLLGISRSQAQKTIEQGNVLINKNHTTKPAQRIQVGDIITFLNNQASLKSTANPKTPNTTAKKTTAKTPPVTVIADTADYMVLNKPIGMLTHPTMAKEKNTLVDFIIKKYPRIKKIGDDPIRPGIVHRLDKEASGLIVVAKTQKMFDHLKEQFKNRTIEKEYSALVHGRVAREWGEILFPIARSENAERMAALPPGAINTPGAKEAKTEFLIEKQFTNFTLLRIKIHTGRMHQIRVHLFAYNHPLVGDPLYFHKKQKRVWDEKLGRLFLHSVKLGFIDLQDQKQIFELPLPKELTDFLTLLR